MEQRLINRRLSMPFLGFGFGEDRWGKFRDRLIETCKHAKDIMDDNPSDAIRILLAGRDVEFESYLRYIGDYKQPQEFPRFPSDMVSVCALRLLSASTIESG